jgi:para-nitrobenzyl esterase
VINGSNHDEYRLFTGIAEGLEHVPPLTTASYTTAVEGQFDGLADKVLAAYPARKYAQPDYAYDAVITDVAFSCNTHLLNTLMARYTTVWEYELNDPNAPVADAPVVPGFSYGSPHSADLSYLFPAYNVPAFHPAGPPQLSKPQQQLRLAIQDFWTNMARSGAPTGGAWPYFTARVPAVLSFDPGGSRAMLGFSADHRCAFWNPLLRAEAGL